MILPMRRIRIMGPRTELDPVLATLQDTGVVHLAEPRETSLLQRVRLSDRDERHAGHLRALVRNIEGLGLADLTPAPSPAEPSASTPAFAQWARTAGRTRRSLDALDARVRTLEAERAEVARFEQFLDAFRGLLPTTAGRTQSYHLILRGEDAAEVSRLQQALAAVLGDGFALESAPLPTGERAALLLVPIAEVARVEHLLARTGVHELPLPGGVHATALGGALPELRRRRELLDAELADLRQQRSALVATAAVGLRHAETAAHDRLSELDARSHASGTPRSFVLEGWVPAPAWPRLTKALTSIPGGAVVAEQVGEEEWRGEAAPVVLSNPRFFQPFEVLTRSLPLPRYRTIDPTPFVAVFFPMFFGLILGDIGYGLVLAALTLVLHRRSRPGSTMRSIAEILGPCAAFAIAFGVAFGEFFGDLGHRWFGLHPLALDRERAMLPFLGLAVAIGLVHVILGLVLGIINAGRGHPRLAVGRGVALFMVLLVVAALLAAFRVLPYGLLTPAVIALLVAFPVLVVLEGIVAPIELLSTLGNVLSYARIMALGTASVMMAVVANRLAGSFGSVLVGILFGLLFHLVNFALGIFAPTVHGLRLHYVEFFGKFYSPGGVEYRPLTHWRSGVPARPSPQEGTS